MDQLGNQVPTTDSKYGSNDILNMKKQMDNEINNLKMLMKEMQSVLKLLDKV